MNVTDLKARLDALIKVLGFLGWIPGNSWIATIVNDLKELEADDAALAVIAELLNTDWRSLLAGIVNLFQHGVDVHALVADACKNMASVKACQEAAVGKPEAAPAV